MRKILIFTIYLIVLYVISSKFTSGQSIYEMSSLKSVNPFPKNCWGLSCETYTVGTQATKEVSAAYTCLGYMGPISSLGPLGALGPLGDLSYSPEKVFKLMGNWEVLGNLILKNGPLDSPKGVLSSSGPLGDSYYTTMLNINDFTKHMQAFGLWSILGPIGPLGALGGLGPLGPVGAHKFGSNSNGDYYDRNNNIVNSVSASWNEKQKINWPLFEKYSFSRAQELSSKGLLDTSFMVKGMIGTSRFDVFNVKSSEKQILSIVTVPFLLNSQFILEVENKQGKVIAFSTTPKLINWVQLEVDANDSYKIKVKGHSINCLTNFGCTASYYLHVVGSTKQMLRKPTIQYSGEYIKA